MRVGLGIALALTVASSTLAQTTGSATVQPVSFARMAARIPAGTPWAHLQSDASIFGCRDFDVLTWQTKSNESLANPEFERIFREELVGAGFKVAGDPTNLFEQDQKSTDLQVGALVTGLDANFCGTQTYMDKLRQSDRMVVKGSAVMQIEWQVYSTSQARVLARVPTRAEFALTKPIDAGDVAILQGVFSVNVRQLAAADAFRAALGAPAAVAAIGANLSPLDLALREAAGAMPLDQAAKGVVSIFAGSGMGSGVLISRDGYILTNHHVAGDAGRVRVRWPDGSETVGDVVRADRRRDVALIKTIAKAEPLAVRSTPTRLGETVYAIGTPREREFAGTLTRGVISTVSREFEGQAYIQSDVAITHGNSGGPLLDERGGIVGLSQSVYAPNGVSQNINFFVPIDDALKALALKPAS